MDLLMLTDCVESVSTLREMFCLCECVLMHWCLGPRVGGQPSHKTGYRDTQYIKYQGTRIELLTELYWTGLDPLTWGYWIEYRQHNANGVICTRDSNANSLTVMLWKGVLSDNSVDSEHPCFNTCLSKVTTNKVFYQQIMKWQEHYLPCP